MPPALMFAAYPGWNVSGAENTTRSEVGYRAAGLFTIPHLLGATRLGAVADAGLGLDPSLRS